MHDQQTVSEPVLVRPRSWAVSVASIAAFLQIIVSVQVWLIPLLLLI